MSKVIRFVLIIFLSLLVTGAPASNCSDNLNKAKNKTEQFYCAANKLKNIVTELSQEENVNINITSLRNKLLLSNVNATCEIYTAAILLKNKLMHTIFYQETNVSVNAIRLFESALVYLDSIAAIQWQIYELTSIKEKCIDFNSDRYLEEYDINIELKSDSTVKVTGPNSIHFSWVDKDAYETDFCLPTITIDQCS